MRAKVASWLKHLKTLAIVLIVLYVLWRVWRGVDWGEVRHSFAQANAFLLAAAMVASGVTNLLRACRWRALLSPLAQAGVHDLFAATNIGIGGSFLFGAAIGELIRPLTLSLLNRKVRPAVSVLTVMVERLFDLSVVSIFFGVTLLWLPVLGNHAVRLERIRALGIILLLLPLLGLVLMILFKQRALVISERLANRSAPGPDAGNVIGRTASRFFKHLLNALGLLSNKSEFIKVSLWTGGQWCLNVCAIWLTLRAFDLSLSVKGTLLVVCCGLVGSLVPTPGGAAGAYHLAISGGLIFLGVTIERAAAISISAHLAGFVPALIIGTYYLLRGSVSLAQLRHEVSVATQPGSDPLHDDR